MRDHEYYRDLISASVDGELSEEERAALDGHLKTCGECSSLFAIYKAAFGAGDEQTDPPEGFTKSVMDKIAAQTAPGKIRKFPRRIAYGIAAAAACVVIAVGVLPKMNKAALGDSISAYNLAPNSESIVLTAQKSFGSFEDENSLDEPQSSGAEANANGITVESVLEGCEVAHVCTIHGELPISLSMLEGVSTTDGCTVYCIDKFTADILADMGHTFTPTGYGNDANYAAVYSAE